MNEILELRQQRAKLLTDCKTIVTSAAEAKRAMTDEENKKYERMFKDANGLGDTIAKAEQIANVDYALKEVRAIETDNSGKSADEQVEAFNTFLRFGMSAVPQEKRALLIPKELAPEMRALTVGTGASGGYTVPQGFEEGIVEAMKFYNGVESAGAETMTTDTGNDIPWPNVNDTSNVAVIVGENTQVASNTDPTFNTITLKAFNYTSNMLMVPNQLLQDNAVDLQSLITRMFAARFGRGFNTHCTTGTGTGQPQGVVTGAALGKTGANGQTTSVTYNDIQDLKFSVDRAYRTPRSRFMMHDQTLKAVVKLVDGSGRPLALDYQPGIKQGDPDVLAGFGIVVNNDMAQMAANAKSILYGDFFNYKIRRVRGSMIVTRLNERYADYFQTGFVGFMRMDGRLQDAGTNPIKYYANSAT